MISISYFSKQKSTIVASVGLYMFGFPILSQAAPPPNSAIIPRAGSAQPLPLVIPPEVKQQERPTYQPVASEKDVKLNVQTFTFSGNQVFTSAQLSALLASYTKREIGLRELNEAAKVVTDHYRTNGYFLAQAYLPAQDVDEGAVEIAILEGKLGELNVKGADSASLDFLKNMVTYRLKSGDTVSESNLVRNLTLLNSLPAMRASAQLNPGEETGSTNAEIELLPLPTWQAYLGANTYGNRYTGREVVLAGVSLNNLAGVGDRLALNLKSSKNDGERELRLSYYTPVHESGTLLYLGYDYVDYALGGKFKPLKASGDSQYFNLVLEQPLVRSVRYGLIARFGGFYKKISDEVSAFALDNRRDIRGVELGLFGDWLDSAGDSNNQLGISIRTGQANFKNKSAEMLDEIGAKTEGDFIKYNLTATRVQYINTRVSVAFRADYQATNKNLDSVEKFSIGGINRWRAFAELPSLADSGWMFGAEIGKRIPINQSLASLLLLEIRPYGFIDAGRGKINQKAIFNDNHVKSIHYGMGMDLAFNKDCLLSLTASHQTLDFDGASADSETLLWGGLVKSF